MRARISEFVDYFSGNHGLTDEIIYQYQPTTKDDRIPIFSGPQDNINPSRFISKIAKNKQGENVVYFSGPCLILTKDGSAGLLTYKGEHDIFTINHHASVLAIKDEYKDKINLEWFTYQYQKKL